MPRPALTQSPGPYSCVGRPLGMVEIRLVISQLVHHFDIHLSKGQDPDAFKNSGQDHFGMVYVPGSLHVDFTPRSESGV